MLEMQSTRPNLPTPSSTKKRPSPQTDDENEDDEGGSENDDKIGYRDEDLANFDTDNEMTENSSRPPPVYSLTETPEKQKRVSLSQRMGCKGNRSEAHRRRQYN